VKVATALNCCRAGVGLTVAMLGVEFCSFYLHLFVLPVFGLPFLVVLTLAPALLGISLYQRALKAEQLKSDAPKAD
jgi:hypothetical protein